VAHAAVLLGVGAGGQAAAERLTSKCRAANASGSSRPRRILNTGDARRIPSSFDAVRWPIRYKDYMEAGSFERAPHGGCASAFVSEFEPINGTWDDALP
jgi:hypothetical protein